MSKKGDQRAARQAAKLEKQRHRFEVKAEFDIPISRTPKVPELSNNDDDKVLWSFEYFDNYDWRGGSTGDHVAFFAVAEKLKVYSQLTWKEIKADPGRDHPSEPARLCEDAQKRLAELDRDDIEELFRFRFSGPQRLWGFRDRAYFIVLWWDPDHQVWPT